MVGDREGDSLVHAGSVIGGKYRAEAELGRGGMGLVVRATHLHLNQSIAIKLLLRTTRPGAAARFEREARTTMRLRCEHTVRVLDAGLHGDVPYLVMELLEGSDLRRLVLERGALPVEEAVGYALQTCEALAEAHALGIVHRDIKPANLFLTRRFDGSPAIKVLDFGVAKESSEEADQEALTVSSVSLGSPMYMAPEQIRDARRVDARADVWSAGVTLFELLTGRGPFEATSVSGMLAAVLSDEPASLRALCPAAPPELELVLRSCLVRNPERRCPSAAALGAALAPFAAPWALGSLAKLSLTSTLAPMSLGRPSFTDGIPPLLAQTEPNTPPGEPGRRRGQPARLLAALAVFAGVAVPGVLIARREPPSPAWQGVAPASSREPSALASSSAAPAASGAPPASSSAESAPATAPDASAQPKLAAPPRAQARPETRVKVDDELGFLPRSRAPGASCLLGSGGDAFRAAADGAARHERPVCRAQAGQAGAGRPQARRFRRGA